VKAKDLRSAIEHMTPAPWRGDDDTPCVYSGDIEVSVLGDEAQNYDGDASAIIALANHADALVDLVAACEAFDDGALTPSECMVGVMAALKRVHEIGK
jgi:hypothetical protein